MLNIKETTTWKDGMSFFAFNQPNVPNRGNEDELVTFGKRLSTTGFSCIL